MPVGTLVTREDDNALVADLIEHGQRITVARGGAGGRGNTGGLESTRVRFPSDERLLGTPGDEVRCVTGKEGKAAL